MVETYEDALSHLRRQKAMGAFSVKSYNQQRRDARQMIVKAARELEMEVVPEGGSLLYFNDTMVLQFSEFGRRINENGSAGTDHGAASVMMVLGGAVRGGIYGTAANLRITPDNPTLENNGQDVKYETDFRSVYSKVIDSWLGGNSLDVLGADFRASAPAVV